MKLNIKSTYKKSLSFGYGTLTIFLINVAFFIILKIVPGISGNILLDPRMDVILLKPWTLITVFFSHEHIVHIIANMGMLLIFGKVLEEITNAKTVIILYLIAGFIGSLTFPPFAPIIQWTGPVIGASAATFGVVSAVGVMRPNYRIPRGSSKLYTALFGGPAKIFPVILFITNIISFILNPTTAVGAPAHAAGIIVGLICGYWLRRKEIQV